MSLYQPPAFRHDDPAQVRELLARHPLATLISPGDEPVVTHLPLLVDPAAAGFGLVGHFARANPHWQALAAAPRALAIVHGPDAYVSPRWYGVHEAVPTWNYLVVHLQLQVRLVDDRRDKETLLKLLIDAMDPPYAAQWDGLDAAYRERMLGGIVGMRAEVVACSAKFKLSQNRPAQDRQRVAEALAAGSARESELAGWMRSLSISH